MIKIFSVMVLVAVFGCATQSKGSNSGSSNSQQQIEKLREQNSPELREFEQIDAQYRERNFDAALKRSKSFLKQYPNSSILDQVYHLRGLSYIGLKQYANAISQLKKTLEATSDPSLKAMAGYNLAYSHFELGQIDQAAQALDSVKSSTLSSSSDRANRLKFHTLRAKIARLRQDYLSSTEEILLALRNLPEPANASMTEPMLGFLDEVLEPVTNYAALEQMVSQFESSAGGDRLLYKLGSHYLSLGERDKAKNFFQRLKDNFPQSRYYSHASEHLRKTEVTSSVDSKRIGVVLSLSGKFSKFGYKTLQGLELALKIFKPGDQPKPITMVVIDDQGSPERATAAMEELVYKHHVVGIVGPLVSKLAEPMAKKAQELGVPLVALTQKEAVSGNYVFNAGLTAAIQVRELIQYAIEKAGVKHFAVLAPSSKFGEEYAKAFWDELDRMNGLVRGYELYQNEETDFRTYIDRMVGLSQTDARARELEELRKLKAATPIKGRSKKFDHLFELKPIVDFEAVFIPDEPKVLGQILPTFAYRDVEKMLFLGINTWHSQELIARAGQFAEGSVFVDGYFSKSEKPTVKKFIEEYRETFKTEPGLMEALAYDAGHVLSEILTSSNIGSRQELRDQLTSLKNFPGITGPISFQAGKLTKRLHLLTVKNGKFEEIAFQ